MKPVIYYCYDAYCGWCYGFSPVIKRIWEEYQHEFDFQVLSGGMIRPESPRHIRIIAPYIQTGYKQVEERTGVTFGQDFLWHIFNPEESDWYPDSLKPAIAMAIFREYLPLLQVPFACDLQYALNYEGRDLCDDEAYRHLLDKYQIPALEFYERIKDERYRDLALYDFSLVQQLRVTGFPTMFLQVSDNKLYQVSRGWLDYESVRSTIESIKHEVNTAKNTNTDLS
jgi:putative protein-disulfide isomerase